MSPRSGWMFNEPLLPHLRPSRHCGSLYPLSSYRKLHILGTSFTLHKLARLLSEFSLTAAPAPAGWGALLGPDSSRPRSCSLSQPACSAGSANLIHHTLTVFCSCTHTLHFFNTAFFPSDSSRLCLTHHDSLVFSSLIFPPLLPRPLIIQP